MMSRGWSIVDRYENTTRDGMPEDETITSFADRLVELAEKVIVDAGGERVRVGGRSVYRIPGQRPANVYPLTDPEAQRARMRADLGSEIESLVLRGASSRDRARGAYLAIGLDLAAGLAATHPGEWEEAIRALKSVPGVAENLYDEEPDTPAQKALQKRASAAGFGPPSESETE